jgi:hypothetical protein
MILFPLDSVLKGDIRGVKGDLRRPFDKALKDYETRHSKLEKVLSSKHIFLERYFTKEFVNYRKRKLNQEMLECSEKK